MNTNSAQHRTRIGASGQGITPNNSSRNVGIGGNTHSSTPRIRRPLGVISGNSIGGGNGGYGLSAGMRQASLQEPLHGYQDQENR
jgi:hypothetical protein